MKLTIIFPILMAVVLILGCSLNGQAQVTAIKAGKLVDPATATTLTNQVILVESGKIKAIGAGLQIPSGDNHRRTRN